MKQGKRLAVHSGQELPIFDVGVASGDLVGLSSDSGTAPNVTRPSDAPFTNGTQTTAVRGGRDIWVSTRTCLRAAETGRLYPFD